MQALRFTFTPPPPSRCGEINGNVKEKSAKKAAVLPRRVCCLEGLKRLSKRLEGTLWTTVGAPHERRYIGLRLREAL